MLSFFFILFYSFLLLCVDEVLQNNLMQVDPRYSYANAGFAYDFQLINVEDYNGAGESSPTPYFYQNLGEAEYAVQLYMYMRLLG